MGSQGEALDIYSNYEQYGFGRPAGLILMDAHRLPLRKDLEEVGPRLGEHDGVVVVQGYDDHLV